MIEFPYPDNLLSKSDSSKKMNFKQMMKGNDLEDESSLKRRLFEKESSEYEYEESSNYNILSYNENQCYVENLITPPPKKSKRCNNVSTDAKQSGIKYIQNSSLCPKPQQLNPSHQYYPQLPISAQYAPQVIFKSHKYKHTTYPYLVPFCNKCNLPPILPIHPDFEMEMLPPQPLPLPLPPSPPPADHSIPIVRPKPKGRTRKKPSVDENGKKIIRRRKRKTYEQLQMLIQEFQDNPEWSKDHMQEVSRKTGLSEAQVYKWGWDQKRKMLDPTHDIHAELKMYEKEREEEEKCNFRKLKFSSSVKKPRKNSEEFQKPKEKNIVKIRSSIAADDRDEGDNKENEFNKNGNQKPETRGVKRKLKMLKMSEKQGQNGGSNHHNR
jgi:hypothetical protein